MIALLLLATARLAPATVPTEEQRAAQAIERALQRHGPEVHRCFEKALADRLDVAGKLDVEVEVGEAGRVANARVLAHGRDVSPALSGCMLATAATWKVDGIEAGASVVLPFAFEGQMNQSVIKVEDVPERGPGAGKAPKGGGPPRQPPFTVKVLADEANVRAQHASLTLLTVGPASRVAMQRHPRSAKVLYLLKGHARLLGPTGSEPIKLDEGGAVFLPAGYPHVIENMGRQTPAVFLQAFAPPGPERVYRDPTDAQGRADFEVIRDPAKATAPAGAKPVVRALHDVPGLPYLGGKATAHIFFDEQVTGSKAMSLQVMEFAGGSESPRHTHPGATELLYVVSGGGTFTVGSEGQPFAADNLIHVPPDQPHAAKFAPGDKTIAVLIYAPAGPEQRFRGGTPQPK